MVLLLLIYSRLPENMTCSLKRGGEKNKWLRWSSIRKFQITSTGSKEYSKRKKGEMKGRKKMVAMFTVMAPLIGLWGPWVRIKHKS
jgi:hypothetical protein